MKKSIMLMLCALIAFGAADAFAFGPKPEVVIGPGLNTGRTPYHQNFNKTLSADTVYVLTGLYYVDSTYTLTIPAGTVVKGDTAATLVISRGGEIRAIGNELAPIIMTSRKAPNAPRARGDWGGVILLGEAPVNKFEPLIEGGIIGGSYGGNDANDSSGIMKYVRIEYPGYRFQINNEVNGLTMGGVGAGTELHHVQVSYSFDDSYEWFGGTVDGKYLVAFGGTDEDFDTDFGYSGRLQFCFGLRDPSQFDPNGESRSMESDNDGNSLSTDEPYTSAVMSNGTLVGPARTDAAIAEIPIDATFDWSSVQRRSSKFSYLNTAIVGYPRGISVRNDSTHAFACRGELQVRCASVAAFALGNDTSRWPVGAPGCALGVDAWFATPSYNNIGVVRNPDTVGLTDMSDLNAPNPVPGAGTELAISPVCFDSDKLQDSFFDVTTYRGAFAPGVAMADQWTGRWASFTPQDNEYNPTNTGIGDITPGVAANLLGQNKPNPFNPSTVINYVVPTRGFVTLKVYNVSGQEVATLFEGNSPAGTFDATFNATGLTSGVYFYRLEGKGFVETRKMVLLK